MFLKFLELLWDLFFLLFLCLLVKVLIKFNNRNFIELKIIMCVIVFDCDYVNYFFNLIFKFV